MNFLERRPSAATAADEPPSVGGRAAGNTLPAENLPAIRDLDWSLMASTPFVFIGTGAVGRPLTGELASLGMRRAALVDRKLYKRESIQSQCAPRDVGREKAVVVALELFERGVAAVPWPVSVDELPHGVIEPGSLVIASLDNRRADIETNRLAIKMKARLVKVNVEPAYLTISTRFYDFRSENVAICAECQMTDAHYNEPHPRSCDGGGPEQATGSPRPLSHLAASFAALAIAQFVASPARWASAWQARQWQLHALGGVAGFSTLSPKPDCRCDHHDCWQNLRFVAEHPGAVSLEGLARQAGLGVNDVEQVHFSARVATAGVCGSCGRNAEGLIRWAVLPDSRIGGCECGGAIVPTPYWTYPRLPAEKLEPVFAQPVAAWGVPPLSVLELEGRDGSRYAFVVGGAA